MKRFFSALILVFACLNTFAATGSDSCSLSEKKIKHKLKKVRDLREDGDFEKAIIRCTDMLKCNPNSFEINKEIGLTYFEGPYQKLKALPYLLKALEIDSSSKAYILFYPLGVSLRLNGEYDKALNYLSRYQLSLNSFGTALSKKDEAELKAEVNREIIYCNNMLKGQLPAETTIAKEGDNYAPGLKILSSEINSDDDDYSPVWYDKNKFIFTSRRKSEWKTRNFDGKHYEDLYQSDSKNGSFTPAVFIKDLNSRWHDASNNSSPDGKTLYIYKGKKNGTIYSTKFENEKWSKPIQLDKKINRNSWETSVAVSFGDSTVYFVSDRTGGMGGRDIYVSFKQTDGKWSEPQNLGQNINTPDDEDSPFISSDGKTLYFASNGAASFGGFDLLRASSSGKGWNKAENMGKSWNTPFDDIYLISNAKADTFFISSSRPNSGRTDMNIYSVTPVCDSIKKVDLQFYVTGKDLKPIMNTLSVTQNGEADMAPVSNPGVAKLSVEAGKKYKIKVQGTGMMEQVSEIELPVQCFKYNYVQSIQLDNDGKTSSAVFVTSLFDIRKDTSLHKNETDSIGAITAWLNSKSKDNSYTGRIISNNTSSANTADIAKTNTSSAAKDSTFALVYFDVNKHDLTEQAKSDLKRFADYLGKDKESTVLLTGHADDTGTDAYNLGLSKRRAQRVAQELKKLNVTASRIKVAFKGESEPIATNETEEGRKQNRRVEMKLIVDEKRK